MNFIFFIFFIANTFAYQWQEGEELPETGIRNPYQLNESQFLQSQRNGLLHTLHWPVEVTGSLLPIEPIKAQLPRIIHLLGLNEYPKEEGRGAYYVPFKDGERPEHPMGYSVVSRFGVEGLTFSCTACHSATLFGKQVMGLTNRFPGANRVIDLGVGWSKPVSAQAFKALFGASEGDTELYRVTRERLFSVEAKKPVQLGLDTSLAHVALSLSHRAKDPWATINQWDAENPRDEKLRYEVADSKPAVWWNVKYKNRWLADGSVLSGNPILTNILWNEIGRGTDLKILNDWFLQNEKVIQDLTVAVYATEPPHITDFISADRIPLDEAMSGEKIFLNRCSRCHGNYEKAWSLKDQDGLSAADKLKTVQVRYFSNTPIKNVGTDSQRLLGMKSLEQLNELAISKVHKIKIASQEGYVPPPLEGIWARYPYFHNNSIPNLCDLFKPQQARVKFYWAGAASDIEKDFDFDCNGYPIGIKTPESWKIEEFYYDTKKVGQSNRGHDFNFANLKPSERRYLIRFLQTL